MMVMQDAETPGQGLAQIGWHSFVGPGWLAQPGWPRYVGWLAGFVGSKYFQTLSWYPGPGSPRIFEPIFFVGILGEPDQRYSLLMPQIIPQKNTCSQKSPDAGTNYCPIISRTNKMTITTIFVFTVIMCHIFHSSPTNCGYWIGHQSEATNGMVFIFF